MSSIKYIFALTWICSIFLPVVAQQPVLDLSFDKELSGVISDLSPKAHQVIMRGNLQFVPDRFGNDCRALFFDGNSSFLAVPHNRSLNMSSFTVSAWVKLPATAMNELQWITLICKGENPIEDAYSPAYRAQLTSYTASVNTASTKSVGTINQTFPESSWFHMAMTYDGQQMTIYRNGVEVDKFYAGDQISDNSEPLNIGRDIPGNREFFEGTMDDLKLFPTVLNRNQIARLAADQSSNGLGSACPPVVPQTPPRPRTPVASQTPTFTQPVPDFSGYSERPSTPATPAPGQPVAQTPPPVSRPTPTPQQQQPSPQPRPRPTTTPTQPMDQPDPEPEPIAVSTIPSTIPSVILPPGNTNGRVETSGQPIPRSPIIQQRKKITEPEITLFLYDHRAIDHDTVDIYLDGVLVLSRYELQRFDRATSVQLPLTFFEENDVHEVSMVAINYGTAGTKENTIGIVIDSPSGELLRDRLIIKRLGKPVGIKLVYKPD